MDCRYHSAEFVRGVVVGLAIVCSVLGLVLYGRSSNVKRT
jgi:hypothetical protein